VARVIARQPGLLHWEFVLQEVYVMKTKVLIVDDEENIRELVKFHIEKEGYLTIEASDGIEALNKVKAENPDLIILDLMLPGIDGLEVCRQLKANKQTSGIPIVMLTAKQEEIDMVLGLELGADDYITKPFSPRALFARVKAVLRRSSKNLGFASELVVGNLKMNFDRHEVTLNGVKLYLTPKEFDLLKFFITNTGKMFSREQLLEKVWGYDYYGDTRTVDVHVRHLRAKLEADEKIVNAIETVRKVGYRFVGLS
jgi:two-component system alkaline phosphatase synthesis response regulator PhoP